MRKLPPSKLASCAKTMAACAAAGNVHPIDDHGLYERQAKRSAAGCLRDVREKFRPRTVLIMGYDEVGDFFVQSSPADPAEAMWLMELAKQKLINAGRE